MTCDGAGAWGSPEACAHLVLTLLGDLGLVVRVEGGLCSQIRMGGWCSEPGCDLGVHGRKRKKQGAVATWEAPRRRTSLGSASRLFTGRGTLAHLSSETPFPFVH